VYRDQRDVPEVLICSGLDPSGGAGFIADTRVVTALGARPVGVVTSLTVQNTVAVQQVSAVESTVVGAQLAALLSDVEVKAVKIGLIGSVEVAKEIAYGLDLTAAPVVWDPIATPSRGRVDFDGPALDEMLALLSPHLTLITPNSYELALLARTELRTREHCVQVAGELAARLKTAVLLKGGHINLEGDTEAIDALVEPGKQPVTFALPRIEGGEDVHGTGCALSSAIATYLAHGQELADACRAAKDFVAARIAAPVRPGRGAAAII
jgi:hydroxymethylpyrimidine/phosphomethylpyrimidine kinase